MSGRHGSPEIENQMVFVTVGSTCFDALVKSVDSQQVKDELRTRGYTNLLIQMGRGFSIPSKSSGEDGSLAVDYFTFSTSIADYMRSASLIISHAGSGSIFETLRLGKPLIVVANEDLMDNHQSELAEVLADKKHLFCATPQTLHQTIRNMDLGSLLPYLPGDAMPIAKLMSTGPPMLKFLDPPLVLKEVSRPRCAKIGADICAVVILERRSPLPSTNSRWIPPPKAKPFSREGCCSPTTRAKDVVPLLMQRSMTSQLCGGGREDGIGVFKVGMAARPAVVSHPHRTDHRHGEA